MLYIINQDWLSNAVKNFLKKFLSDFLVLKIHRSLDFIVKSFSQFQVRSQLQGGDINIQDNIGFTPLMEAISRNNKQAIDILLQNSADLELYDKRDRISFICKIYMQSYK